MPRLSVTLIVRNEERNLDRALASVSSVADEIIVADTGSTDGTLDVARRFDTRVVHFPWCDDFSAARNWANSLATGDWIFMLDADEELLPESQVPLTNCLADPLALAFSVMRQDLADKACLDRFSEMWQLRLFRNRPEMRLVGRIHEHFPPSVFQLAGAEKLTVRESHVRIRHYGYVAELKHEKHSRAIHLLEMELRDRPGQFYYYVELGLTLLAINDVGGHEWLGKAAELVADGQPQATAAAGPLAMLLEYILATPQLAPDFPLSRRQARELVLAKFPTAIPLLWQIAREHDQRGEYAPCARLLEMIISLGRTHSYDHFVSFAPHIMRDDARLNLGACYVRLGNIQKAEQCFRSLADSPTRSREAADNLRAIKELRRR